MEEPTSFHFAKHVAHTNSTNFDHHPKHYHQLPLEAPTWSVLALTWLCSIAIFHYLTTTLLSHRRQQKNSPPGPKPWPIIGNFNLIGSIPHQSFHLLSQKYGEIMQLKFGSFPVLVVSSPEMAKEVLKVHDETFASRPPYAVGKYNSYNYSDMSWAPYGAHWRQARRIYVNELFSPRRIDSYEYIRVEERRALMSRLHALSGKKVVIKEELTRFTLTNITRMVYGSKYFSESESDRSSSRVKLEELKEMVDEWFFLRGMFNVGDWIPWLGFLDLQGYVRRMKALFKKFDRFNDIVIADHKAKREAEKEMLESDRSSSRVKLEELKEMVDEWFFLRGMFNVGDWIPWLGFLDLQGYVMRMKALFKKFDRFNDLVIADHKAKKEAKKDNFVAKDMVDVLLQLADDPNLEVKLSSDRVKGLLQDPIPGGTDTSAITVEWAVSELLKQPQLLEKAIEELDRVIGKHRWVEEDDLPNLPYLDAIVKETLRLHPVATLLAPHSSTEDCKVAGYDIPKGTTLLVNVWSIGRDPRYWEEHKKFLPERFIGKNIDVKGQHFELLPFGSGRRMCPAYRLGLKLIKSTLANLLHGFELKLPDNVKPEDVEMEEEYGLTTHRKIPIVAVVGPRLPTHLYALE